MPLLVVDGAGRRGRSLQILKPPMWPAGCKHPVLAPPCQCAATVSVGGEVRRRCPTPTEVVGSRESTGQPQPRTAKSVFQDCSSHRSWRVPRSVATRAQGHSVAPAASATGDRPVTHASDSASLLLTPPSPSLFLCTVCGPSDPPTARLCIARLTIPLTCSSCRLHLSLSPSLSLSISLLVSF